MEDKVLKCPGSGDSTIEYMDCPACGEEIETFSDDPKAACGECGEIVFKESNPSCVAWCDHATLCVGEDRYEEIMSALKEQGLVDEDGNFVGEKTVDSDLHGSKDNDDDVPDEMDLELSF